MYLTVNAGDSTDFTFSSRPLEYEGFDFCGELHQVVNLLVICIRPSSAA